MMRKLLSILATCTIAFLATPSVASPPVYRSIDYPGATSTFPVAVNGRVIVGSYLDANGFSHGFILTRGTFAPIDAPGAGGAPAQVSPAITIPLPRQGTFPVGIGGSMEIAGYSVDASHVYHGFVRSEDGEMTSIDIPGAINLPGGGTQVTAINQEGELVGSYRVASPFGGPFFLVRGFFRSSRGQISLVDFPGSQYTAALAINDNGEIAGAEGFPFFHPFYRSSSGVFASIDGIPAGPVGAAVGINERREIVGTYVDFTFVGHGFYRSSSGQVTTFDPPGSRSTAPQSINEHGEVVGSYLDANNVHHGFFRSPDGAFTQIDVPGASQTQGGGTQASAISEDGDIVGTYADVNGTFHGFLRKHESGED